MIDFLILYQPIRFLDKKNMSFLLFLVDSISYETREDTFIFTFERKKVPFIKKTVKVILSSIALLGHKKTLVILHLIGKKYPLKGTFLSHRV